MSFIIQGPYPLMRATLVLPSPREGNQQGLASTVQTMRSMNGTVYTYIKAKRGRKTYTWDFVVTKDKVREVVEFVKRYAGDLARVQDHNGTYFVGYLTANPYDFEGQGRAGGYPSGEVYGWTLTLEEEG